LVVLAPEPGSVLCIKPVSPALFSGAFGITPTEPQDGVKVFVRFFGHTSAHRCTSDFFLGLGSRHIFALGLGLRDFLAHVVSLVGPAAATH